MKILVVDDEDDIRSLICLTVKKAGFETVEAETALLAVDLARAEQPDLVILDLMLPDMNGLDVCRILKGSDETKNIPIIMVTAKIKDSDVVKGLELGADDYITKPFSLNVLVSRIKSVLRRCEMTKANDKSEITVGNLKIDTKKHEITVKGKAVDVSATEFSIIELLSRNAGQVFSRKRIISDIKGEDYPVTDRSIDVQVLDIRRKFETAGLTDIIQTVRGVGYKVCE